MDRQSVLQARQSAYLNIGNASMVQDVTAAESCVLASGACHEIVVVPIVLNDPIADRLLSFWKDWNPSKQKLKNFPDSQMSSRIIGCEYNSTSNTPNLFDSAGVYARSGEAC